VSAATAVSSVLRCRSTSIAVCRTATCIGAGGLPFEGPWGTSFAANPTPDPDTGIGRLTDGQIVAAIHGARRDGTRVLPPMPTTYYTRGIPEADLRAIVAYLRSLEPVRNAVPPPRGVGD
jgi:hypothetical protein